MIDLAPNAGDRPAPRGSLRADAAHRRNARFTQTFANILAVLMRDPALRNMRLVDLEWLVLPAILSGQWKIAQSSETRPGSTASDGGTVIPSAVALWASVSAEIDARLSATIDKPLHLKSHEWLSGDILWLVAAAGDPRIVPHLLKQLAATEFKGKLVKARITGPDGKAGIRVLREPVRQGA